MKRNYLFRSWFENVYTEELNEDVVNAVRLYFSFEQRSYIVWRKYNTINTVNYHKQVWDITEKEMHKLTDIHRRGVNDLVIDHIIPISYACAHNYPIEIIGSIDNLQMMTMRDNCIKGSKITPLAEELISKHGLISNPLETYRAERDVTKKGRYIGKAIGMPKIKLSDSNHIRVYDMNTAEKIMEFNL